MFCVKKKSKKKIKVKCQPQLHPQDQWIPIGTGNYYKGKWNHRTMFGDGIYVMQSGNCLIHFIKIFIYTLNHCVFTLFTCALCIKCTTYSVHPSISKPNYLILELHNYHFIRIPIYRLPSIYVSLLSQCILFLFTRFLDVL